MRFRSFVMLIALATPAAARPTGFEADFRRDPARAGFVVQGEDDGRFAWLAGRHLLVTLDSNAPGARLVAPLGMTLDGTTSFVAEADVLLGWVDASPDDFFQIGLGLVNLGTTGLNRTGTSLPAAPFFVDDSDVFDSVEISYFPNVTFFGGPFLQPTVFGAERGSAFANFAANFGPSADLGDNGPGEITELPQGRPLRVAFDYDACSQQLTTRILDVSGREAEELETGLLPLDLSALNATGTFTVDAFGIHAYQDLADFDPSTRSLAAQVEIRRVSVKRAGPPSIRILPRALNADARHGVPLRIDGAAPDAPVVVVESGGHPVSVPLDVRAAGDALLGSLPADLAQAPLWIRVGGCVVPVDVPTRVPR